MKMTMSMKFADFHHGHRVTGSLAVWSHGHREFMDGQRS